jgi:hypothetical protein
MLFNDRVILAKKETTSGTDASPAGTDAVLTKNLSITPYDGPVVSRGHDRSTAGGQIQINTSPRVSVSFDVELAGSGTAGDAPAWGEILECCGFDVTLAASTSATYSLLAPDASPSLTIKFYNGGQEHEILGARGNVSFSLARGALPSMSFNFIGTYSTPTAVSNPTAVTTDYVAPVAITYANTPTYTIHGTAVVAESMTVDLGNIVVPRNLIGADSIILTDRAATGSTVIEAPAIGTKNWFSSVESDSTVTTGAVSLVHGTTAGNIVTIGGPAVQLTSLNPSESEGLTAYTFATSWVPSSGNDEIEIVLT